MNPPNDPQGTTQIFDLISSSTVKISSVRADGTGSTGTGFFYIIARQGHSIVPLIVTNNHVVKDAVWGELIFSTEDAEGNLLLRKHYKVSVPNFEKAWTPHSDPSIDLCVTSLVPIMKQAKSQGINLHIKAMDKAYTPTQDQLIHFDTMENIVMVGYPNGIADDINNRPILRRGTTATHINIDYQGKPEFLIDCAVFPGSSGSPVFIADPMGYSYKGDFHIQRRLLLVGIAYAVMLHTATGQIIQTPINQINLSTLTSIPNNLGRIIRFDKLFDFEKYFKIHPDSIQ